MGQKVNPIGLRIGIIREWDAKWYAPKTKVADLLHEDLKIRKFLNTFYKSAYVSRIETKRTGKRVIVTIHAGKPGLVIGLQGSKKNEAVKQLEKITGKTIFLTVVEVKQAESDKDARIVSRKMAEDLENRASFRRVQKMAIQKALKVGAKVLKQWFQDVLEVLKLHEANGIRKEVFLFILSVLILIMQLQRQQLLMVNLELKFGLIKVRFYQKPKKLYQVRRISSYVNA